MCAHLGNAERGEPGCESVTGRYMGMKRADGDVILWIRRDMKQVAGGRYVRNQPTHTWLVGMDPHQNSAIRHNVRKQRAHQGAQGTIQVMVSVKNGFSNLTKEQIG